MVCQSASMLLDSHHTLMSKQHSAFEEIFFINSKYTKPGTWSRVQTWSDLVHVSTVEVKVKVNVRKLPNKHPPSALLSSRGPEDDKPPSSGGAGGP